MVISTWDMHKIRTLKGPFRGGRPPLIMFSLQELWDAEDKLCPVDDRATML